MNFPLITLVTLAVIGYAFCIPTAAPTTEKPKEKSVDTFVPHATYLSANSYVDNIPYGVAFNPQPSKPLQTDNNGFFKGIMPSAIVSNSVLITLVFSQIVTYNSLKYCNYSYVKKKLIPRKKQY